MAESDVDCRKIWESIEKDTEELLKKNIEEKMRENLISVINQRVDELHKDIDQKGEEFMEKILTSFKEEDKKEENTEKKGEVQKISRAEAKAKELKEKKLADIDKLTDEIEKMYKKKMFDLFESLENVVQRTSIIDTSVDIFKNSELKNLLLMNKDGFGIKVPRSIATLLKGKNSIELNWETKNNASYSTIDKDEPNKLKIHGTTCYTYYQTTPKFKDEDFGVEIEFQINGTDDYFYLGIINEKVVPASHCMCCTIANGFYFQPNGDIILNGSRQNNGKVSHAKNAMHLANLRILLSVKEMYISIDDKEEVGPLKIIGETFTFTSGTCNSKTGYIKILNCYYC